MYEMLTGWPPFYDKNLRKMCEQILRSDLTFPPGCTASPEARDIIRSLLSRDPAARLGSRHPDGAQDIKNHPFFKGANWEKLERKEVTPPFVPRPEGGVESDTDIANFDTTFTSEPAVITPPPPSELAQAEGVNFEDFGYVSMGSLPEKLQVLVKNSSGGGGPEAAKSPLAASAAGGAVVGGAAGSVGGSGAGGEGGRPPLSPPVFSSPPGFSPSASTTSLASASAAVPSPAAPQTAISRPSPIQAAALEAVKLAEAAVARNVAVASGGGGGGAESTEREAREPLNPSAEAELKAHLQRLALSTPTLAPLVSPKDDPSLPPL